MAAPAGLAVAAIRALCAVLTVSAILVSLGTGAIYLGHPALAVSAGPAQEARAGRFALGFGILHAQAMGG